MLKHFRILINDEFFKEYDFSNPDTKQFIIDVICNNMTYHKDKVSVLVQTCDSYSHFWEGWYVMFNRFWAWDLDQQIYFCNEEVDFPYKDDRIKQIKTGKSKKY